MNSVVVLTLILPLISFLIIALVGKRLPKKATTIIAPTSVLLAFLCSLCILTYQITHHGKPLETNLFNWINVGSFYVPFTLLADSLSAVFICVITGVGGLIHIYATGYMHDDPDYNRFFSYLNLFVFFMLILVLGNNLLLMFVGWEGVGLCSYLLIGFWFKNKSYSKAANKAFIMNRIGDLGFLLGIFLAFGVFGSVIFKDMFNNHNAILQNGHLITGITLLLFVGAMGKSAQIPLYTWLPDAMAGPTPVSALIHAATMVTAGIYLVARCNVLFSSANYTLQIIAIIGITTSLLAATIALFQNDIKKVLAYSTVSQLGLIFMALGVGAYTAGVFHVVTHAFFKALLFLGAGSVIHGMSGDQDIRNMGGLKKLMPTTHFTFLIGTIAISGIPPLAGFFSKDQILASTFVHHKLIFILGMLCSLMTCFYMFRLYFLTFHGSFRGTKEQHHHVHESPKSMTIPLVILATCSILVGFIGFPHKLGNLLSIPNLFDHFLATTIHQHHLEINLSTEVILMAITTLLILIIVAITFTLFVTKNKVPNNEEAPMNLTQQIIYHKFYIDEIYQIFIVRPILKLSNLLYQFMEKSGIDGMVNGLGNLVLNLGNTFKFTQVGNLSIYLLLMIIAIAVLVFYKFYFLIYNVQ